MATRTKSAPARKAAATSRTTASTKAVPTSGKAGVQASKAAPKDKRRVWDYIKKSSLQDQAKKSI